MVKLLHHYETQSSRIFLLLQHVQGGRLVDHVQSIRDHKLNKKKRKEKRKKSKKETAEKQDKSTTSVVPEMTRVVIGGESEGEEEQRLEGGGEGEREDVKLMDDTNQTISTENEDDDKHMQNLLEELTNLAPPTSLPVTSSLGGVSTDSQTDSQFGENELDELRKQLEDQEIKEEEEEEEEEGDILSELRKQLMELTSDSADQEGQANLEKQLEEELAKEKTVLELEEELEDELEEAIEETVEELQDDTNLMELERQLMAFTTMIPEEEAKTGLREELISIAKGTTDALDEGDQFNSVNVSDDTMENTIVTEDKPNFLGEVESHSDVPHPLNKVKNEPNKPHSLTEVENQFDKSHPLSELEDQPTSSDCTVISVVPPTPTTPSSEHLSISAPSSSLSKNINSPKSGSPKPVDEVKK